MDWCFGLVIFIILLVLVIAIIYYALTDTQQCYCNGTRNNRDIIADASCVVEAQQKINILTRLYLTEMVCVCVERSDTYEKLEAEIEREGICIGKLLRNKELGETYINKSRESLAYMRKYAEAKFGVCGCESEDQLCDEWKSCEDKIGSLVKCSSTRLECYENLKHMIDIYANRNTEEFINSSQAFDDSYRIYLRDVIAHVK